MLFTSYEFLVFLTVVFLLYYLAPKRLQWVILLAASLVFYLLAGPGYLIFILLTIASSYVASRVMGRLSDAESIYLEQFRETMSKEERKAYKALCKKKRFRILVAALVFNFGILAILKYTGFTVNNINSLLHTFGSDKTLVIPSLLLPLGISFYTFQTMGYLIDVYREKAVPEKNPARLALFVSFFPQLIQGPISRYGDLAEQLYSPHKFDTRNFTYGAWRILWGYFKKLVIADRVLIAINTMLDSPEEYGGAYVVLLVFLYSIEIYGDFTGGIDITIGIAEALGIKVTENFNHPFFSKSTKEYWRRWHITMGTWFTDYIFYPVSVCKPMMKLTKKCREKFGNNIGKRIPVYLATILTWFLTGLWHGAGWNFIVWGLLNCLVILVSQELEPLYKKFHGRFPRLTSSCGYSFFMMFRTFWLMGFIRSLDCYRDVPLTFRMWGSIFTEGNWAQMLGGGIGTLGLGVADFVILACGCLLLLAVSAYGVKHDVREKLCRGNFLSFAAFALCFVTVIMLGAYGVGYDATQFIYNQF